MNLLKSIFYKSEEESEEKADALTEKMEVISEEITTAIATAIFLYKQEVHDYENTILTIKRIDRTYSPWSSKIYGLRKNPRN
jgi:hypothetical protein